MSFIFILFLPVALIIVIDFFTYILRGKRLTNGLVDIFSYGLFPIIYLSQELNLKNNCCYDTAFFSPQHRTTAFFLIGLCIVNYFFCLLRKKSLTPLIEVIINSILMLSILLNFFIFIHAYNSKADADLLIPGVIPVILLSIMMLSKNSKMFLEESEYTQEPPANMIAALGWKILNSHSFIKYPVLLVICFPILFVITIVLLLFGQKPDSVTRAFTDTYRHGLSQLDHECAGVICEGHYLCTIAAKGHRSLVKPIRLGIRGGQTIICNRQLLVSNAFEEIVQQHFPKLHYIIRRNYDHIGNVVERYYTVFNNKLVSDLVYILMKPLEWFFLMVLYCCDKKPENRIARQYTSIK